MYSFTHHSLSTTTTTQTPPPTDRHTYFVLTHTPPPFNFNKRQPLKTAPQGGGTDAGPQPGGGGAGRLDGRDGGGGSRERAAQHQGQSFFSPLGWSSMGWALIGYRMSTQTRQSTTDARPPPLVSQSVDPSVHPTHRPPNPSLPSQQVERATVILREMPSDTPEAKLKSFFDALPGCPPIKGLRADVNDMWCVPPACLGPPFRCG